LHQPEEVRLCLTRPAGYGTETVKLGTWLFVFGMNLAKHYPQVHPFLHEASSHRIGQMRNMAVEYARSENCKYLLTVDPDAWPDPYVRWNPKRGFQNRFRPFWDEAWRFMQEQAEQVGPCVLAAPACGKPPAEDVQVFARVPGGRLPKIKREYAQTLRGWERVGAVGTHMMLIDMRVFDRLEPPYFEDQYTAIDHVTLKRTQDVKFCKKCYEADVPTCRAMIRSRPNSPANRRARQPIKHYLSLPGRTEQ